MKKLKLISVYHEIDCYDVPQNGKKFIMFFQDLLKQVPSKFINSAEIIIKSEVDYDEPELNVQVCYTRPETDEEEKDRETGQQEITGRRKRQDLQQLKRLQEKYPEEI